MKCSLSKTHYTRGSKRSLNSIKSFHWYFFFFFYAKCVFVDVCVKQFRKEIPIWSFQIVSFAHLDLWLCSVLSPNRSSESTPSAGVDLLPYLEKPKKPKEYAVILWCNSTGWSSCSQYHIETKGVWFPCRYNPPPPLCSVLSLINTSLWQVGVSTSSHLVSPAPSPFASFTFVFEYQIGNKELFDSEDNPRTHDAPRAIK